MPRRGRDELLIRLKQDDSTDQGGVVRACPNVRFSVVRPTVAWRVLVIGSKHTSVKDVTSRILTPLRASPFPNHVEHPRVCDSKRR
jgi:hypothetical protein